MYLIVQLEFSYFSHDADLYKKIGPEEQIECRFTLLFLNSDTFSK